MDFYEHYKTLSQEELFEVVLYPESYRSEAKEAARQVIREKGWSDALQSVLNEHQELSEEEEILNQQDIIEKAEYYRNVVEFKNKGFSFDVRIGDIPRFESMLEKFDIPFFREDKNIGVQLDTYPTQTYYFKHEDTERVDAIAIELKLITAPYTDIKPFWNFELKAVLIVVLLSLIVILLANLL